VRQIEAKAVEKLRQPGLEVDLAGFVDDAVVERARRPREPKAAAAVPAHEEGELATSGV
jgi:hypothetical protein